MADEAGRNALQARRDTNHYEATLLELATLETKKWAALEDLAVSVRDSGFEGAQLSELRTFARDGRIEALGQSASHRLGDPVDPRYKELWDTFREMADNEIGVYEKILQALDTRDPSHFEQALASARLCVSLGERAILLLPTITQARLIEEAQQKAANTKSTQRWVYGCLAVAGGFVLLVLVCTAVMASNV